MNWIAVEALTTDSDLWQHGQVVSLTAHPSGRTCESRPYMFLTPANAGTIADVVGLLATATPDQHRELAEGIRLCAALITAKDTSGGPT